MKTTTPKSDVSPSIQLRKLVSGDSLMKTFFTPMSIYLTALLLNLLLLLSGSVLAADKLAKDFKTPPVGSRAWCYWWWLNGAASNEGITRDFEEMRKQGIGGALLFDAGEAGPEAPRGPKFMSDAWRELYRYALREADRCGIVLTVNLCSGWNAGGPWVTHENAAKKLVSSQTVVKGPERITVSLPKPKAEQAFYRDIAVLACPVEDNGLSGKLSASSQLQDFSPALAEDGNDESRWISNGNKPGMGPTPEKPEFLQFDLAEPVSVAGLYLKPSPESGPKDIDVQCSDDGKTFRSLKRETLKPDEAATITFGETRAKCLRVVFLAAHLRSDGTSWNVQVSEIALLSKGQLAGKERNPGRLVWDHNRVVDVTRFMDKQGQLVWSPPVGYWKILRLGYTLHGKSVSCVGGGPTGLEIDPMSTTAMDAHFAETGAKLIADAGPLAGKTLQYFHIDSWEIGQPTWTPLMREEFKKRRGYDPLVWLPAVLGLTVDNAAETHRFIQDYRRTAADLVAANYYGRLRELTVKGGLRGTHPESGGPFFRHWIDALQCEGVNDIPMGEFWKRNFEPDGPITWPSSTNPTVKQVACAAHICGKPVCQAEAFTSFADDWTDDPWNMKDIGDAAFCEGLTRNVLCFWVHQSRPEARPGFQWAHVGTHFDCNLTWWPMANGWLTYLARCQHMLRQGLFVADFVYLKDETIPGFIEPRPNQQPMRPAGFDYDVLNAEVLQRHCVAKDGRLVLPDGMSYRYLVLPHQPNAILSPATLKKINVLSEAGVTVIAPRTLAGAIAKVREGTLDAVVKADDFVPDIKFRNLQYSQFDWIHRRDGETDIYFISNQTTKELTAEVAFRVVGKQPELWDAVTGSIRELAEYRNTSDGRTEVSLKFAPRQSFFIVFRRKVNVNHGSMIEKNFPELKPVMEVAGAWEVQFDPKWFYDDKARIINATANVTFEKLEDWTKMPEGAIKYYSGVATYHKVFDLQKSKIENRKSKMYLTLGVVKNLARVRLNGRDLGVVWTAPWQVAIPDGVLREKGNELNIEVANLWPNRLIGDAVLPKEKRLTVTNVRTYDTMTSGTWGCKMCEDRKKTGKPAELLPSGLMGPVKVVVE